MHSFGFALLRAAALHNGERLRPNVVLEEGEATRLLVAAARETLRSMASPAEVQTTGLSALTNFVRLGALQAEDIVRGSVPKALESRLSRLAAAAFPGLEAEGLGVATSHAISRFRAEKRRQGRFDLVDLLEEPLRLARTDPGAFASVLGSIDAVLLDEVQDLNPLGLSFARTVARGATYLFAVGDPRQSIYGFLEARPELMTLPASWGEEIGVRRLVRNYRSCETLVAEARSVLGLDASTMRPAFQLCAPGVVERIRHPDAGDEAEAVLQFVRRHEGGSGWAEVAVLARTRAQLWPVEERLVLAGLPVLATRGAGLFDDQGVSLALCYFRLLCSGDDKWFRRVYGRPNRYLGRDWLNELIGIAASWGVSLLEALDREPEFSRPYMRRGAEALRRDLSSLRRVRTPQAVLEGLRQTIGLDEHLRLATSAQPDAGDPCEGVERLADWIREQDLESSAAFLDAVDEAIARRERRQDSQGIRLITIHASKGLEFEVVALIGVTHGLLPHVRAQDRAEEARLAYVAVSRAKRALMLSTCAPGVPSWDWSWAVEASGVTP